MYKVSVIERRDEKFNQNAHVSFGSDYVIQQRQEVFGYDLTNTTEVTFMSNEPFGVQVDTILEKEIISTVEVKAVEVK